jgi:hypothetical protein
MNFRKSFGLALALTLLLSSCSSPPEEARSSTEETIIDTGILARLVTSTGFSWKIDSPSQRAIWEKELLVDGEVSRPSLYNSEGYIQMLYPTNFRKCTSYVYVYTNEEFAKNAKKYEDSEAFVEVLADPLTGYGIILTYFSDPCRDDVASTFDFVIPQKN